MSVDQTSQTYVNSEMHVYVFDPKDYKPETKTITLHGPTLRDQVVFVKSRHTGIRKTFLYDKEATSEEYMNNEGWDGEQNLSIFRETVTGVTLRVWSTPYDEF